MRQPLRRPTARRRTRAAGFRGVRREPRRELGLPPERCLRSEPTRPRRCVFRSGTRRALPVREAGNTRLAWRPEPLAVCAAVGRVRECAEGSRCTPATTPRTGPAALRPTPGQPTRRARPARHARVAARQALRAASDRRDRRSGRQGPPVAGRRTAGIEPSRHRSPRSGDAEPTPRDPRPRGSLRVGLVVFAWSTTGTPAISCLPIAPRQSIQQAVRFR